MGPGSALATARLPGTTADLRQRARVLILATRFVRVLQFRVLPPRTEGAGKAGRRLRPHRRVQWVVKNAHGFDRYSRDIPAFPAQWLYGLYVLSPGSGLSCPRCVLALTSPRSARVAAPGPHDFAVRCECLVRQNA